MRCSFSARLISDLSAFGSNSVLAAVEVGAPDVVWRVVCLFSPERESHVGRVWRLAFWKRRRTPLRLWRTIRSHLRHQLSRGSIPSRTFPPQRLRCWQGALRMVLEALDACVRLVAEGCHQGLVVIRVSSPEQYMFFILAPPAILAATSVLAKRGLWVLGSDPEIRESPCFAG